MTDTRATPDNVALADRAERILEMLRVREPTEADEQACSMVIAGLRGLSELRGPEAVCAFLVQAGPIMAGHYPGGPLEHADASHTAPVDASAPQPGAASAPDPQPRSSDDMALSMLDHLRGLAPDQGHEQARAAIRAATAYLGEVGAPRAVVVPGPAPEVGPPPSPDQLACAVFDHLRGLNRGEAHERARAVVAGSAAYLHEVFGRTYASALLAGTLDAAASYGDEARGGRDTLDTLH